MRFPTYKVHRGYDEFTVVSEDDTKVGSIPSDIVVDLAGDGTNLVEARELSDAQIVSIVLENKTDDPDETIETEE